MKIGKITKQQILTNAKKVSREIAIESNMNYNRHRVHKSAKDYNRQTNKRIRFD